MAKLEPCPNCRKMISTDAVVCPKCGQPLDRAMWEASRAQRRKLGQWVLGVVGLFTIVIVLINALNPSTSQSAPTNLFKMNAVFVGNPDEQIIKGYMDRVAARLGVTPTDALYGRWGSVLVALRKDTAGVSEIEILRCVEAADVAAAFPDLAALCSTSLEVQN